MITLETPLEGVWVGERVTEETEEETVIKEEGKVEEGKVHSMTVAGGMGVTHKGMVGEAGRETGDTMTQEGVWVEGWVEGVEGMMEAGVEDQHMEIEAPAVVVGVGDMKLEVEGIVEVEGRERIVEGEGEKETWGIV